ncbi:MAG: helix-turn-helix domain-containing protein [Treponema sp.]|jgi:DNA-binding LacI/PurR family transcriptional regulator/AraC-like DNA-binding protein|nr:helix-turn-helix domain-containing protein [Treponema sp.]
MVEKKKIGLILASIHTGSACGVWSHFAQAAMAEKTSLFVFPGGKLNASDNMEYLRNPIYSLANAQNLDGLISWSSSIGCSSLSELSDFHKAFEDLPYTTISDKIEGHPCVRFDAYDGMKSLTRYFIQTGSRNIAFLRGPDTHHSAMDRYQGFRDAIAEIGVSYDERLVSDPFDWGRGAAACVQLFTDRGLRPVRDFDTLIGSSDLMTLPAILYLQKQGISSSSYRAGGFNNSIESKIKPFSTVEIPYTKMSAESFKTLKTLMESPDRALPDVTLPCRLVVRSGERKGRMQENLSVESKEAFVTTLAEAFNQGKEDIFLETVAKQCVEFLDYYEDIGCFFEALDYAHERIGIGQTLESETYRMVSGLQEQRYVLSLHEREERNSTLNSFKCELLGTKDRKSLVESMARHLPKIGVYTAFLAVYKDEDVSEYIGGFSSSGVNTATRVFPARRLFPTDIQEHFEDGIFLVQPLFIENQPLGYFVHNIPFFDGVILEELRSAVGNAFKGISLFEETFRAKQLAESSERAKTEFFAAVGNNLNEPFKEALTMVESLEADVHPEESPKIFNKVKSLKDIIIERQNHMHRLIEMTISQTDTLSFKKTLFNIRDVLPELEGEFPLLLGDEELLAHVFALIKNQYRDKPSAHFHEQGLEIRFKERVGELVKWAFTIIERIILLHCGKAVYDETSCSITLPWTTFSGQITEPSNAKGKLVLILSEVPLDVKTLFGLPVIRNVERALSMPDKIGFILWSNHNGEEEGEGNAGALSAGKLTSLLRTHPEFFQTPFLCFGKGLDGETISQALDARNSRNGSILFIGDTQDLASGELSNGLASWIDGDVRVDIASSEDFFNAVSKAAPDIISLRNIDIEMVKIIRNHPATAMTPIIVIPEQIKSPELVKELSKYSRVVLCNRSVAGSSAFCARVRAIAAGDSILPLFTGALVKKAILYFNQYAHRHIFRWKLADAVGSSEDYITRIFRKEMGMSLWRYLNHYRVFMAVDLLIHSGDTIAQIADKTGFQDQAYFCRVFRNIYGKSPGWLRK